MRRLEGGELYDFTGKSLSMHTSFYSGDVGSENVESTAESSRVIRDYLITELLLSGTVRE